MTNNGTQIPVPTVGRSEGARGPAGSIIRAEELQFWTDGKGYLEAAKAIFEQSKRSATDAIAEARHRGYQEGLQLGQRQAIDLIAQTKVAVDTYDRGLSHSITELVIGIVAEVLGEVDAAEAVYLSVRKALKNSDFSPDMTLLVSPAIIESVRARLLNEQDNSALSTLALVEDTRLAHNGAKLVSEFGTVDLSIDKQISILSNSLRVAGIRLGEGPLV